VGFENFVLYLAPSAKSPTARRFNHEHLIGFQFSLIGAPQGLP
jgi:hypothetical protein